MYRALFFGYFTESSLFPRYFEQLVEFLLGRFDAAYVYAVRIVKTHHSVAFYIRFYIKIEIRQLRFDVLHYLEAYYLVQYADYRTEFVRCGKARVYIHSYYNIGAHTPHFVDRKIIQHPAVYKHATVYRERGEQRRESTAGTHRFRQVSFIEFYGSAMAQVRHFCKIRYIQTIEIIHIVHGNGPVRKQVYHVLSV